VGAQRSMGMTEYSVPRAPQCTPATQPLVRMQPAGLPRDAHHAPHAPCMVRAREATRQRKCKQQSWGVPRSGAARPAGGGAQAVTHPSGSRGRTSWMSCWAHRHVSRPHCTCPVAIASRRRGRHRESAPVRRSPPIARWSSAAPVSAHSPSAGLSAHFMASVPRRHSRRQIFCATPQRATPKLFKTSGIYSLP